MELTKAVIFCVGFLVVVSGLPAPGSKDEVESVPAVRKYGDQPIVDTGYFSGWDNPFSSNPFGGLFDSLESVMARMRQQIAALLNHFPLSKGGNSTDELPSIPGFNGVDLPSFPSFGNIDLSKGNTSSVTKVIDGHTVVINETEYKNEDDFGGTFFKVRIIDVKPDSSELTTEKEAEAVPENVTQNNKDREEIENSYENEIPRSKEVGNFDKSPEKLRKYA